MCLENLTKESFYSEGVIATTDLFIFFLSTAATRNHFQDSGGQLTSITYFHIIHSLGCFAYGTYHYLLLGYVECQCNKFNLLLMIYISLYVLTFEIFLRYWKKNTRKPGAKREWWQLRVAIYGSLCFVMVTLYARAVFLQPCDRKNFFRFADQDVWFIAFPALVGVIIDTSILAYCCICRLRDYINVGGDQPPDNLREAIWQVSLFVMLPVTLMLGGLFSWLDIRYMNFQLFLYLLPSMLMLVLMWKRNYVVISDVSENQFIDDYIKSSHLTTSHYNFYDIESNLSESLLNGDDKTMEMSSARDLIQAELVYVPTLEAEITTSNNLTVEEELKPSFLMLPLVSLYLGSVVLPMFECMYKDHLRTKQYFMRAAKPPKQQSIFANLELETQYEELTSRANALSDEYLDFLKMLRMIVIGLQCNSHSSSRPLKRSQKKTSKLLAHLPTNLNTHSTVIHSRPSPMQTSRNAGESRCKEEDALLISEITEGIGLRKELLRMSSVTVGAPACHSLGWKVAGGLNNTLTQLEELKRLKRTSIQKVRSPEELLHLMQLQYSSIAHGSIVMSEALCSLLVASLDVLSSCLRAQDVVQLRQFGEIGLLVHSASLLSTSGKEEFMLDDFLGAYETLQVTVEFESGGRRTTSLASDAIMEVSRIFRTTERTGNSDDLVHSPANAVKNLGEVTVVIRVFDSDYFSLLSQWVKSIQLVPVLFNLGVNEAQSLANISGSTLSQSTVNRIGMAKLRRYYVSYDIFWKGLTQIERDRHLALKSHRVIFAHEVMSQKLESLEYAIEVEITEKSKDVNLLLLGCFLARAMNGARTTSCKSAKDRTSVFHTLELVRLAQHFGSEVLRNDKDAQDMLDLLRSNDGVRLRNCELNIGQPYYSFNQLQLRALPPELRPPPATATGGKS